MERRHVILNLSKIQNCGDRIKKGVGELKRKLVHKKRELTDSNRINGLHKGVSTPKTEIGRLKKELMDLKMELSHLKRELVE